MIEAQAVRKHSLFFSQYCYFCQKVLMSLRGHQHPVELLNTSEGDNRSVLMRGGGKGQVPCLRIESDGGVVDWLYESDDILHYINAQAWIAYEVKLSENPA